MKRWLDELPPDIWLRDGRAHVSLLDSAPGPADNEGMVRIDLRLQGGGIAAVAPFGTAPPAPGSIDLSGGQIWPCLVDGHVHLDKTEIWARAVNPTGTHPGAVAAVTADRTENWSEADIAARFTFGLSCAYAHGTAAMRTHIDSYGRHARNGWAAFRRLRDSWAGRIALQASSLCPINRLDGEEGEELADLVAESGGLFGLSSTGTPIDDDFRARLDRFFALAEARGLDVDLHVDESGEQDAHALREVALTVLRRGFRGRIQCGHCCALAVQPEEQAAETIRLVADAGIAIIVLPMCNMYLQGRQPGRTPRWRGVTLVHEFRAAGIPVSFASDNCRDPFYPYGDYDMMEVFREAVRIAQLDQPFADWPASVAATPATMLGMHDLGRIRPGASADLILFRARGMSELLSRPQADRAVVRAGRMLKMAPPDWRELDELLGVAP
jgi:cytosine deaminase